MYRTFSSLGIILKTDRIGEINKSISLFLKNGSIINAIAYGSLKMKSKLRSSIENFNLIKAYMYFDPVKKSYKIEEAECQNNFPEFRKSLKKYYASSFIVEIIMKSYGGGESSEKVFRLLHDSLVLIDKINENNIQFILIQFLFRFINHSGITFNFKTCPFCDKKLDENSSIFYLYTENNFSCGDCVKDPNILIPKGAIKYIEMSSNLDIIKSVNIRLEKESFRVLKTVLLNLIQSLLETRINSLDFLTDIL